MIGITRLLRSYATVLLPLGLWAMLWLGLAAGNIRQVYDPGSPAGFLHGLRAAFPLIAAFLALFIIFSKQGCRRPNGFLFLSPLGLTAFYGLVGVIASLRSPDGSTALYWAAAYLSVPLVLWAIVLRNETLSYLPRLINLTWLSIILLAAGLFAAALLYLDLGSVILDPSAWLRCSLNKPWMSMTGEAIRSTGVGRMAAISAIIALTGLFRGNRRLLWAPILLASIVLLVTSGARTALIGFTLAGALVVLLYGGRRAALTGVVILALFGPLVWFTDVGQEFLGRCIFRNWEEQSVPPPPSVPETEVSDLSAGLQIPADTGASVPLLTEQQPVPTPPQPPADTGASVPLLTEQQPVPTPPQPPAATPAQAEPTRGVGDPDPQVLGIIPENFFEFTGRTAVWKEGWSLFKESPVLGYGFQADRLLLGTHMHNAFLQSLVQTGLLGTIPFLAALIFGWGLLIKALRNLNRFSVEHKHLVIQTAGILVFFSIRSFPESTGAFFGIDWLLLAPLLLYLTLVDHAGAEVQMQVEAA